MPTALTTIASVKLKLGIADTASDTLLQKYVDAACQTVESWLGRVLGTNQYTLTTNGNGRASVFLNQYPVTAITSVTVDGVSIPASTGPLAAGYAFDGCIVYLRGYAFTKGIQNVVVVYTAGYAAVPTDVADAVDEIAILNYKRRDHIDTSSKSLAGETVNYVQADMPESAKLKLQNYKMVATV